MVSPYVKKNDERSVIATGLSVGTTKITVKEKVAGKLKTLGNMEITVIEASIPKEVNLSVADSDILFNESNKYSRTNFKFIKNQNLKAEYEFVSSDESIIKIVSDSQFNSIEQKNMKKIFYEAVNNGMARIQVKEIYNGKKRNLGTIKVTVSPAYLDITELELGLNLDETKYLEQHLIAKNGKAEYIYTVDDDKIVSVDKDGHLNAKKIGETVITVSESIESKIRKVGTINVAVKYATLTKTEDEIGLYERKNLSDYAVSLLRKREKEVINGVETEVIYEGYSEDMEWKATSSNPKVVSIKQYSYKFKHENGKVSNKIGLELIPKKEGSTNINIKVKYEDKIINLGTVKIRVINKPTGLIQKKGEVFSVSNDRHIYLNDYLKYSNLHAKYTFTTNNKELGVISEGGYFKTKKEGIAKVTAYETLNGKKRKIGIITFNIESGIE